jgi:hypothetical protein
MARGDNTFEALMKGGKTVVKTPEGWQAPPEPGTGGGGGGPGGGAGMMGRMLSTLRPPAAEAEDLLGKVKELRKTEAGFVGDLTEEGAKQLLTRNRRGGQGGGEPPAPQGAKGTVKFWVKDGVLAKFEVQVQGRMAGRDGQEIEVNRTTTTEISNVGTTKVEVAEAAKKVLG